MQVEIVGIPRLRGTQGRVLSPLEVPGGPRQSCGPTSMGGGRPLVTIVTMDGDRYHCETENLRVVPSADRGTDGGTRDEGEDDWAHIRQLDPSPGTGTSARRKKKNKKQKERKKRAADARTLTTIRQRPTSSTL